MIIVKILGGLGNQMFCYAYAQSLRQKGFDVKIDISEYKVNKFREFQLNKFKFELPLSTKEENQKIFSNSVFYKIFKNTRLDFSKKIREKKFFFDENLLTIKDNSYVVGYFQSEKYFKSLEKILVKHFTLKPALSSYSEKIKRKIQNSNNTVSIHVRRGDFLNSKNVKVHGLCNLQYYQKSINYLEDKFSKLEYYIFSDDIKWCRDNLKIDNSIFIDSHKKRIPHEDLYLMSLCKNNIIANSSFSWWGAWLNRNVQKIVIAPKLWLRNKKDNDNVS